MKHESLTEEQIIEAGLMAEGTKDFTIDKAREYISDKGNPTFELNLIVFDDDGTPRPMRDWVTPKFPKKFKHLHDTLGIMAIYDKGETGENDLVGKSGKVLIKVGEPRTNKDGFDVRYNEVVDYIKRDIQPTEKPKATDAIKNDEIPF